MLEDPRQLSGRLTAEGFEIHGRDEGAGQVGLAGKAQGVLLDGAEPAVRESAAPEAARRLEEVEVERRLGPAPARQHESRLEQRQIEARAVVGHDPVHALKERIERGQERGLLVQVPHEVLPYLERLPVEEAHADEEGVGARAPGETGRLGIEIDEPRPGRRDPRARQERQRRVGHRAGRVEKLAPVEMAGLEAPADQEHAPMTRLLDGAAQEVFERGHLS